MRAPGVAILLTAALLTALGGCAPDPVAPTYTPQLAGVHLFIERPFRAIPEPDPFIQGAALALTEEIVRSGYDFQGITLDPGGEDELQERLVRENARRPGTGGLSLVFLQAPSLVGYGPTFASVSCTVYSPQGGVLLRTQLEPPSRRPLVELVLPRSQPDVEGRYWAARMWQEHIAAALPGRR